MAKLVLTGFSWIKTQNRYTTRDNTCLICGLKFKTPLTHGSMDFFLNINSHLKILGTRRHETSCTGDQKNIEHHHASSGIPGAWLCNSFNQLSGAGSFLRNLQFLSWSWECPVFYGNWRFFTVLTTDRHLSVSWTSAILFLTLHGSL
jgi:hypothetical protein